MSHRTGILFPGAPGVPEMVERARLAEARGFESVWVAETRMTRDAFVPLAAIAQGTERVRVGSGIVNVYTRNPVVVAISFIGLEELAPGRIVMGLGAGSPLVLAPQGVAFDKPLTRLREYCDVIPRLVRGESVSFRGQAVTLEGAQVEDLLSHEASPGGPRTRIPLCLGVTGPRAMAYAGEVADVVLMNSCLGTDYVLRARELLEAGARRAGRNVDEIEVAIGVATAVGDDSAAAKRLAARWIGLYTSLFPNIARATGVDPAVLDPIARAFAEEGLEAAARRVDDDLVDRLAVAGTPDECRARLDEYRAVGVDVPVIVPLEGTFDLAVETLA